MKQRLIAFCFALAATLSPSFAVTPDEMLADPFLEARARAVSRDLRCVVCQNQSIDDSNAPLAHDMRVIVRERIAMGESNAEVKDFLVRRYGNYVLLSPPVQPNTILLWTGPFGFLLIAVVGFALYLKRSPARTSAGPLALSDDERARFAALNEEGQG
jgi:cytochrome c-type biogenesis protein CcmH